MRSKKRKRWFVILFFIFVIVLLLIIPVFTDPLSKWTNVNSTYDDIDIKTGRTRRTRYLFYCKVNEKIEDSILTEAIGKFNENEQPDWHHVYKSYPGKSSPHYAYHGAISQIHEVEMLWKLFTFSDEAKKHMAQTVLDKWQTDGNYFGVTMYLLEVSKMCDQKEDLDPNVTISVDDLEAINIE